jgi:hypothetical protein
MKMDSKREYLATMRERYEKIHSKQEKSALISEVVHVVGVHRKHAIRILRKKQLKRAIHRSPRYRYGIDLCEPLQKIWEIAGRPCSKRLEPQIGGIIRQLKKFGEITLSEDQEDKLCTMSNWTIDQLLKPERERLQGEGIAGTRRSPLLKTLIPIRTEFEGVTEPGHIEMDTVLHCGETVAGEYGVTVNMIDIATHWNEKRMIMRKTQGKVVGSFHRTRKQFPFPILSIDFDNGDEFVNWCLLGYCKRHKIAYTRSRPYQKNDQAHIEGKNFISVRKVTGYGRIEDQNIIDMFNDIYENEHRLLTNFFYPTLKLKKKVKSEGKTKKQYEEARTPYQRVLQSSSVSREVKQRLREQYKRLNPAQLHRSLQAKLAQIRKLFR